MICPYWRKTFNEPNSFDKSYSSITNVTLISILNDLKHYTATYSSIAKCYNVSPSTVVRIFDNHVQLKRHHLQEIICIDDFISTDVLNINMHLWLWDSKTNLS